MTVPTVPTTPTTTKTPQTVVDASASTFVRTLTAVITVLGGLSSLGGIVLSAIHQGSSGPDIALIAGGSLLALVANLTAGIHHNAIANMIGNLAKSGELSTILGDAATVLKGLDPALLAALPAVVSALSTDVSVLQGSVSALPSTGTVSALADQVSSLKMDLANTPAPPTANSVAEIMLHRLSAPTASSDPQSALSGVPMQPAPSDHPIAP